MATGSVDQCTYIIRAWKEVTKHPDEQPWRFVLLMPDSTRRQGFGEVEQLCKALHSELLKIIQQAPS